MIDYTETYTAPGFKLDNGKPVLLWVRYHGSNKGDYTVTIKGACNPIPFNKITTSCSQAIRLKKWLEERGWKYLGYSREM